MEEIKKIAEFFTKLFTPMQQGVLIIITLCVLAVTQMFKPIFFGFMPMNKLKDKKKKNAIIHLFVFTMGVIGGVVGYFITVQQQPLWFWVVTGLLSGIGSIVLFKLSLGVNWLGIFGLERKKKTDNNDNK